MIEHDLYPDIECDATGRFALDPVHEMYWEVSGNPEGMPAVFLHGGPGAGTMPVHRRFFDPTHYRIVLFDQRGAGRSKPLGEIRDNTTRHLIADMERLRNHLGIDRWLLFGGSWGSTLALAYAETHPERCLALVLRGVFLGTRGEREWFLGGVRHIFPETWRAFVEFLPAGERDDVLGNYYRRLTDSDPEVHLPAARSWSVYEGACSTLRPSRDLVRAYREDGMALGLARLEAHYFVNDLFLPENHLIENIWRLDGLPATIVHGRYDMVCPIASADTLHHAWPGAEYVIVDDAGHSAMEPGIRTALVQATDAFRRLG